MIITTMMIATVFALAFSRRNIISLLCGLATLLSLSLPSFFVGTISGHCHPIQVVPLKLSR